MTNETFATFILSTGRCGTQWIATSLADVYSNLIDVSHEPLHDRYDARNTLNCDDPANLPPAVLTHLQDIEARLRTRRYLECGHPAWSAIPQLAKQFPNRFRIVHLTRHPVTTSCSLLTQRAFQPPLGPWLDEKILLSPFDDGIRFTEYQQSWESLSPFEKCLYYWSEVHAFALELEARQEFPWLRLRYEDFFDGNGLSQLLEFLELPPRDYLLERKSDVVDEHRFVSDEWRDWQRIQQHPRTLEIAEILGYDCSNIDESVLLCRYLAGCGQAST